MAFPSPPTADLDSLDPTVPDGAAIVVAQLDDYQREDRSKVKDWALTQHGSNGALRIPFGTLVERDAYYTSPEDGNLWIRKEFGLYVLFVFDVGWREVS